MSKGLVRTQYWNVSGPNPTPRTGLTSRAESRTDLEEYQLNAQAAQLAALYGSGVAVGLQVSAAVGALEVSVSPGTALDLSGRIIVLAAGSAAIVDPLVGPSGVQNIPTVPVSAAGVVLDTSGLSGDLLLTLTWREVEEAADGLLVLRQAPWLRLVDAATFVDDGLQLPLAAVTLRAGGGVDALAVGPRRMVASATGRLELRLATLDPAAGPLVAQTPTVELVARPDGGADLNLLSANGPVRPAFSAIGSSGDVELGAGLRVSGATALGSRLAVDGGVEAVGDISTGGNLTAGGDLAVAGDVAVDGGLAVTGALQAASTTVAALAVGGSAMVQGASAVGGDLAVHGSAVVGAGANGVLTSRHINGKQVNNDGPDGLFLNWDNGQTVQVGGGQAADLELSRNAFVSGQIGVKTHAPAFDVHVNGTVCAVTFCNPSDLRLKSDVSALGDVGERLARVRAVTFTPRAGDRQAGSRRQAGVVAQEVLTAFPELVIPMGSDGLMAVDYAGLAAVLVGAVNELREASTTLAARMDDLERPSLGDDDDQRG